MSTLGRFDDLGGNTVHEADVSTERAATEEDSRLPRAYEDQGRAESSQASTRKGAETADRLTGRFPRRERLTTSAEFQALFQRGKRIDRPSMVVLWRVTAEPRRAGSRSRRWPASCTTPSPRFRVRDRDPPDTRRGRSREDLPMAGLAPPAERVPIRADVLGVRAAGARGARPRARCRARGKAPAALPSIPPRGI